MDSQEKGRRLGGEMGRRAGKFVKNAGPRTKRLIEEGRPRVEKAIEDARPKLQKAAEDYRPKVEQAGRDAVRYAEQHQDEIKGLAIKGVRMRLGPLGVVLDALGIGGIQGQPAAPPNACPKCSTINTPQARFCTECGASLAGPNPGGGANGGKA
jgi:hypothetical protein